MKKFLKLKIKSLASEAKFIKEAERSIRNFRRMLLGVKRSYRHKQDEKRPEYPENNGWEAPEGDTVEAAATRAYEEFWGLKSHRLLVVRRTARTAHIAYGFLRGKAYRDVELFAYELPSWEDVRRQVLKFGDDPVFRNTRLAERYDEWERQAKEYFIDNLGNEAAIVAGRARPGSFKKLKASLAAETPNENSHI